MTPEYCFARPTTQPYEIRKWNKFEPKILSEGNSDVRFDIQSTPILVQVRFQISYFITEIPMVYMYIFVICRVKTFDQRKLRETLPRSKSLTGRRNFGFFELMCRYILLF